MQFSRGLRTSLGGGILVAISMIALLFLPDAIPAFGMMIGGLAVIGGFIWTLAGFYFPSSGQEPKP